MMRIDPYRFPIGVYRHDLFSAMGWQRSLAEHANAERDSVTTHVRMIPVYRTSETCPLVWRFGSSHVLNTPLPPLAIWFFIHLKQAPSCGDSGSPYILSMPYMSTTVHHIS